MEKITIYKDQLSRMRSMNRYYHDQFLIDVRVLFVLNTIFIFLSLGNSNALYLLPLISLFGSVILSFHAYFLIFSRQYTQFIEQRINTEFDEDILIAHELENEYFFPINQKKIESLFSNLSSLSLLKLIDLMAFSSVASYLNSISLNLISEFFKINFGISIISLIWISSSIILLILLKAAAP